MALLKEDAIYTMPPTPQWYAGRQAIFTFFEWAWKAYEGFRLIPTGANGQPAFAAYLRVPAGIRHATAFYVLTLTGDQICAMTRFEASVLPWFGLPRSLPSR